MILKCQKFCAIFLSLVFFAVTIAAKGSAADTVASLPRFDVNDVAILWPVPKTGDDLKKLIALNEKLADGISPFWPETAFQLLVTTAQGVTVTGSGGQTAQIKFRSHKAAFESATNWKIAGIRIDPSAPGCSEKLIAAFGSTPQIRLIVQPVTQQGEKLIVHDVAAHLVFDFVEGTEHPAASGLSPRIVPDKAKFKIVLDDLAVKRAELLLPGLTQSGN